MLTETLKARKELIRSVRQDYKFRKKSLENDIEILWRETPGKSMFDNEKYIKLTISSHPYLNDSTKSINETDKSIIGIDFLTNYLATIEIFKRGVRRYHPDLI